MSQASVRWRQALSAAASVAVLLTLWWPRPHGRPRAGSAHGPGWFQALRSGDMLRTPAALASRKLTLAGETRNAFPAEPTQVLRLKPLPGAQLELAAALRCEERATCRGAVRFELHAEQAGKPVTLASFRLEADWIEDRPEALPLQGQASEWHVERLELPDAGGGELSLTLVAQVEPAGLPGPPGVAPQAFWAEPLLLAPAAERPNLLLVSLDTLRADRLGCYGYARDTSPNLDRLAEQGLRFEQAIAQAPWTTPSHMSLMTGLYPSTHGVTTRPTVTPVRRLGAGVPTLAALLRQRGYQTRAYTGGGTMGGSFGFDQGFDVYHDGPIKLTGQARDEVRGLLQGLASAPFFLYLHTFEVHAPYTRTRYVADRLTPAARADWPARFDLEWLPRPGRRAFSQDAPFQGPAGRLTPEARARRLALKDEGIPAFLGRHGLWNARAASDLYDGGVREADGFLGELLLELQRLGLDQRTVVAVTSDHGEEFGEHDPGRFWDAHCSTLFDELLRVPLLIRLPQGPKGVVREQVQLVDVAPTLLEALGAQAPATMQGRSLLPLARGELRGGALAFAESTCEGPEAVAVRRPDYKLIAELDPPRRLQLFQLARDPGERVDRSAQEPERTERLLGELRGLLAELRRAAAHGEEQALGEDERERLRALGYVR